MADQFTNSTAPANPAGTRNLKSDSADVNFPANTEGRDATVAGLQKDGIAKAGETTASIQNASDRVGAPINEAGQTSSLKEHLTAEQDKKVASQIGEDELQRRKAAEDAKLDHAMSVADKL